MGHFLDYFQPKHELWRSIVKSALSDARRYQELNFVADAEIEGVALAITPGIYFVDETLMADGDWQKLVDRDQRAIAREMESSGFAQACGNKIGWLVFKACSDFGDTEKDDAWQQTAAFTSALAVKFFLETEYRAAPGSQPF